MRLQVEGLVAVKAVQVQVLSPALLRQKGLRQHGVNPFSVPTQEMDSPASLVSWPGAGSMTGGVPKQSKTCGQAAGILSRGFPGCRKDLSAHPVRRAGTCAIP